MALITLLAEVAASSVEQRRTRGVQMLGVRVTIMDGVVAMIEAQEGASESHTTQEMRVLVVVLVGSQVIGCVAGLDVMSIISQVAMNVFGAKLLERPSCMNREPLNLQPG